MSRPHKTETVLESGFSGTKNLGEPRAPTAGVNQAESFDLGIGLKTIPNKIFFRIGEVADLLDVKTYVLRFWETEFPMILPTKSESGQRVYRKNDVETLMLIRHLLYVERFSIAGARKKIKDLRRDGELTSAKQSVVPKKGFTEKSRLELRSRALELRMLAAKSVDDLFKY